MKVEISHQLYKTNCIGLVASWRITFKIESASWRSWNIEIWCSRVNCYNSFFISRFQCQKFAFLFACCKKKMKTHFFVSLLVRCYPNQTASYEKNVYLNRVYYYKSIYGHFIYPWKYKTKVSYSFIGNLYFIQCCELYSQTQKENLYVQYM